VLHIQIGPSPLALGLLVPFTLAAGFEVCIVGRPGDTSPAVYGYAGTGPKGRLGYHRVTWFEGPQRFEDLPSELRERLRSDEPTLLTCTLREKIADRRAFVEELIRSRPAGAETILLACENSPHDAYRDIGMICDELGVTVLRTVVNRMCIERPLDSDRRRMVSAHELGEWLVERPKEPSRVLSSLEAVEEFGVVDDIEARLARKLWMVNGAHQALALIAWHANRRSLERSLEEGDSQREAEDDLRSVALDRAVSARLSYLHAAMNEALESEYPSLEGNLDYGLEHVLAYGEHPDSIKRVLGAFLRLELVTFIEALEVRLARPARACAGLGRSVEAFKFVFDVFESLVLNLDAFLDSDRIRRDPALIDPEIDALAIKAYASLLGGWMSVEEAKERVARLTEALAGHC
jgi:hypothetical protein